MEGTATGTEVLVLTDGDGNLYAIPRETVERHKLSGEGKAGLEKLLGEDVSGYMQLAGPMQIMVDPVEGMSTGMQRAEETGPRVSGGTAPEGDVSMLPLTALTGFFTIVQDLGRYLNIEESNIRLA